LELRVRVFKRSVGPNDIVGPGGLLVRTHLSCEPLAGFVAAQASRHQSRFLRLDPTERGNDLIEVASMSRLEQEWNVDNGEPSATGELEGSQPCGDRSVHRGVNDGLEIASRQAVGKNEPAQLLAVNGPGGVEHIWAESGCDSG